MSKELKEIRRRVQEGQKKRKLEEQELEKKSKQRITTTIISALDKKQGVEQERADLKRLERRRFVFFSLQKVSALVVLFALTGYVIVKAVSVPPHPLTTLVPADANFAEEVPALTGKIYSVFRNNDSDAIKTMASRLDEEWVEECCGIFGNSALIPYFERTRLMSPDTDPNLCLAFVPAYGNITLQFVFRRINGRTCFEGAYINRH